MIAYKLFRVIGNDLVSVCINDSFPEYFRVVYSKDNINYPKVLRTRLFIFDTLANAKDFKERLGCDIQVWKCNVTDMKECKGISSPWNVEQFWDKINSGLSVISMSIYSETITFNDGSAMRSVSRTIPGSYTCSSVVLLEKLS